MFIIKRMSKAKFRDLFPTPIFLMLICLIFLSVIVRFDNTSFSTREYGLMKVMIYVLGASILIHFMVKALWWKYLTAKQSSFFEPAQDESKNEVPSKEVAARDVPCGYKLLVSQEKGFSFCYPESWQIIRSKEKLLYMQVKEVNLEQGLKILRNFNISHQNIAGIPNTDFLFKMIIKGLLKAMGASLEFKEPFRTEETFGMRYKLKYNSPKRTDLCCYQVAITNNEKKSLILLTFTAGTDDFPKTKKLFDEIASLVKIF